MKLWTGNEVCYSSAQEHPFWYNQKDADAEIDRLRASLAAAESEIERLRAPAERLPRAMAEQAYQQALARVRDLEAQVAELKGARDGGD